MTRVVLCLLAILAACGDLTDPATRIAYDVEASVSRLAAQEGATYTIQHPTPSRAGECTGPYTVQFDKVGALIVWCKDAGGNTVSSHSTSYHARFVATDQTFRVDKPAGSVLMIQIERRQGGAVITNIS